MFGITERGDAALDLTWRNWTKKKLPAILITKDPAKLLGLMTEEELSSSNIIVHCTITGFGGTKIEPNVPDAKVSIEAYKCFCSRLGEERVVLRVDPIVPTDKGIKTAKHIIAHSQSRVRISFLDMYDHVRHRFADKNIQVPFVYKDKALHAPLELRESVLKELNLISSRKIEVCGEPGMQCTGCISKADLDAIGYVKKINQNGSQRYACKCASIKKELLTQRKQCKHNCLYCYWK